MKGPPRIAEWLLARLLDKEEREFILGDCGEIYRELNRTQSTGRARYWYWNQVIKSIRPFCLNRLVGRLTMLSNYFKTGFRNLKRTKAFSFINITGLAIGLACCMILLIYAKSEMSFDTYHEKVDRIFVVGHEYKFSNLHGMGTGSNARSAGALKAEYPEVMEAVRFRYVPVSNVKAGDKEFSDDFFFADESVFNIFTWPLIMGDKETALSAPYTIVITESAARRYFGAEEPLGRHLTFDDGEVYSVTGVMQDIPRYSTLRFDGLCSFASLVAKDPKANMLTDWISFNFETYILLKEGVDNLNFEKKIRNQLFEKAGEELEAKGSAQYLLLQPLRDMYLRPFGVKATPIMYVTIFVVVAVFILLIACANFMNLSTARSFSRATEVGMRKVMGASRSKLIHQFLSETILLAALSMVMALVMVLSILPLVNDIVGRDLYTDLLNFPWLVPGLLALTVLVGLGAGIYPALFLSRFQPAQIVKDLKNSQPAKVWLRRMLVVLQFAISITLIIATAFVMRQLDYLKNKDPGFNKHGLIYFFVGDDHLRRAIPLLREKFMKLGGVVRVGASAQLPGWGSPINDKIPEGYGYENMQLMHEINVDNEFIPTMEMQLVMGRNFSDEFPGDPHNSVIINQAAARKFGWENPLGKTIKTAVFKGTEKNWESRTVVGVINDYHIARVTQAIEPAILTHVIPHPFSWGQLHALVVRIKPGHVESTIDKIKKIWRQLFPNKPFNYRFLDQRFNLQFAAIERSRNIFSYFTLLAIFIACMGLLGMSIYTAENKRKEIGIRKTLGSSVRQIVALLSREIVWLVLGANLIAYPLAFLLVDRWLRDFPYRTHINVSTFFLATLVALAISLAAIAYQSIKAALANPVDSLRYE